MRWNKRGKGLTSSGIILESVDSWLNLSVSLKYLSNKSIREFKRVSKFN